MTDTTQIPSMTRRHDLDALRAMAMLLGILIHAMLSFIPQFWPVEDRHSSHTFGILISAIHGFRMPLFFLVSGFFTAMLFQKRGPTQLLRHRSLRILLPFLLLGPPIIGLTEAFIEHAIETKTSQLVDEDAEPFWSAVRLGENPKAVETIAAGLDLDRIHPTFKSSPLAWASIFDRAEVAQALIEAGARPNEVDRSDGSNALHKAAFFGNGAVAEILRDAGTRVDTKNRWGQTPLDASRVDWTTTKIVMDQLGIKKTVVELKNGRRSVQAALGASTSFDPLVEPSAFLQFVTSQSLYHLWFLWYLYLLVLGYIAATLTLGRATSYRLPKAMISSPLRIAWLVPLTTIPLLFMGREIPNFGPDTAAVLVPAPAILIYYAIFFFFGAALFAHRSEDAIGPLRIAANLGAAVIIFILGLVATFAPLDDQFSQLNVVRHGVAKSLQSLYGWLVIFGLMGLFRRIASRPSRSVRFLSDASYWLYLAHLPLVLVLQFLFKDAKLSAFIKLPAIVLTTSAVLLVSYALFVRKTPLGTLLNGRPKTTP